MNYMKKLNITLIILFILSIALNVYFFIFDNKQEEKTKIIEKWNTDTIKIDSIQIKEIEKIKWKTKFDTIIETKYDTIIDSVLVEIPIYQHTFDSTIVKNDIITNLNIGYSGYKSQIDYISFDSKIKNIESTTTITKKKRINQGLNVGLGIGYGFTPTSNNQFMLSPYIGFSVNYGLNFNF